MFKFQDNLPEYYLKESRDFQIFPRLNDILFMGIHQDVSTINELNNPKKCKNSHLNYLAEKVGFYTDKYIPDKVLINIISAFRTAVKNKGTLLGIEQAVIAILKAENSIDPPKIVYVQDQICQNEEANYWDKYTINIYTPIKILNKVALDEFLKYIIPAGHTYNVYTYKSVGIDSQIYPLEEYNIVDVVRAPIKEIGVVRSADDSYDGVNRELLKRVLGTVDLGIVVSEEDYNSTKQIDVVNIKSNR